MGVYEPLNLLLRENILLQHLVVNDALDSLTWIFCHQSLRDTEADDLLKPLQYALGSLADTTRLKIVGKLQHHIVRDGIGLDILSHQRMIDFQKINKPVVCNTHHPQVFLVVVLDVSLIEVEEVLRLVFFQAVALLVL